MGRQRSKFTRKKKITQIRSQKSGILGIVILYMLVNAWIICGLLKLEEYADLIALSYQERGITESAYDQWKENVQDGIFSRAAVWKKTQKQRVWSEDTGREEKLNCYQVKGWPGAILGREPAQGRYFTEGEEDVCLLDQETAQKIFGSKDILGLELRIGENSYRITGILDGERPICVVPARKDTVFEGIAVQKSRKSVSSKQAAGQIEAVFGRAEGQQVDGQLYYVTAWIVCAGMAAAAVIFLGLAAGSASGRKRSAWLFFVAAGILLCGVKTAGLGSDYLPTYWSDFDFFVQIFKEKTEQIQSLMAHQEFFVWQEMLHIWRKTIVIEGIAAASMLGVCTYRWKTWRK